MRAGIPQSPFDSEDPLRVPAERYDAQRLNQRLIDADQKSQGNSVKTKPRVAILSLLFNWPSTGGGIIHTAELARFLHESHHDVCHFYAVNEAWKVGSVQGNLPYPSHALVFGDSGWNEHTVKVAFQQAVDNYEPDFVVVTDSWNSKVTLAEAVKHHHYFIRLAALECLCPLNNVRLIPSPSGRPLQCRKNQLATPGQCRTCVSKHQHTSGALHAAERAFAGFEQPNYSERLLNCFHEAAGVLAVNPLIATACEPYSDVVKVIPSGFDPSRFDDLPLAATAGRFRFLFAGLTNEYMKGFHILMKAAQIIWKTRQDFEVVVTADSTGLPEHHPFISEAGWQTQDKLPRLMAECHAVVVPTVAQEALGRTAVEAMGASRPVIASRIGGLPFTVSDGLTGILVEPANVDSLVSGMTQVLDDQELAVVLGRKGREKFEREFTWDVILHEKYGPLFEEIRSRS